jgi:hypothetical protein
MKLEVGIFSFGYWDWGSRVKELRRRFLKYNKNSRGRGILWVDIRIRRNVRAKGFNGDKPQQLLGKRNYVWLQDFGNEDILNHRAGVKIRNYEEGFRQLRELVRRAKTSKNDLILFCSCECLSECHRNNVMKWLKKRRISGAKVYGEFPAPIYPS